MLPVIQPIAYRSFRSPPLVVLLAAVLGVVACVSSVGAADDKPARGDPASSRHADERHHHLRDRMRDRMDERVGEALSVLRDVHPELAARVERAFEKRPRVAHVAMRKWVPMLLRLAELRERDREMYELRIEDLRLARRMLTLARYHKAWEREQAAGREPDQGNEPQQRQGRAEGFREKHPELPETSEAVREQLRQTLAVRFEVRTRIRRLELARLKDRFRDLAAELEERSESMDELIDERLRTILDDRFEPGQFLGEAFYDNTQEKRLGPVRSSEPQDDARDDPRDDPRE